MFTNRLISSPRHLLSRKVLPLRNAGETLREKHVISVPPRAKLSPMKKIICGIILGLSMFSTPAWILYHLPDYQKIDRYAYAGK